MFIRIRAIRVRRNQRFVRSNRRGRVSSSRSNTIWITQNIYITNLFATLCTVTRKELPILLVDGTRIGGILGRLQCFDNDTHETGTVPRRYGSYLQDQSNPTTASRKRSAFGNGRIG